MEVIEEHGQEEIDRQDDDEGNHERIRRGLAYPFGTRLAVEAAVATDERDSRAEEHRLDQSDDDVPELDMPLGVLPVMVGLDVVDADTDQGPAHDAHEIG